MNNMDNNIFTNHQLMQDAINNEEENVMTDVVNQPAHYNKGGMEAIDVIEAFGLDKSFHLGNVIKYILRSDSKHAAPIEDLKKARWYLDRHIKNLEAE